MTTHQQRAEAQARAWLDNNMPGFFYDQAHVESLAKLLLATEAACLDEVAIPIVYKRCIGFASDDEPYELIINELREQAAQRRKA